MRWLLLVALIAGCVQPVVEPPVTEPVHDDGEPVVPIPGPMDFSGTIGPSASVACPTNCAMHDFRVNGSMHADVALTWTTEVYDLDLAVLSESGQIMGRSTGFIPQTGEIVSTDLTPGNYTVEIKPYASGLEPYEVKITFSRI